MGGRPVTWACHVLMCHVCPACHELLACTCGTDALQWWFIEWNESEKAVFEGPGIAMTHVPCIGIQPRLHHMNQAWSLQRACTQTIHAECCSLDHTLPYTLVHLIPSIILPIAHERCHASMYHIATHGTRHCMVHQPHPCKHTPCSDHHQRLGLTAAWLHTLLLGLVAHPRPALLLPVLQRLRTWAEEPWASGAPLQASAQVHHKGSARHEFDGCSKIDRLYGCVYMLRVLVPSWTRKQADILTPSSKLGPVITHSTICVFGISTNWSCYDKSSITCCTYHKMCE